MRTTAGVKVPLSSLLATGAEVAIFLGAGTLRVGGAFGLLSGCKVISFPCSKSLTCFSRDSISSAIAAARANCLDVRCTSILMLIYFTACFRSYSKDAIWRLLSANNILEKCIRLDNVGFIGTENIIGSNRWRQGFSALEPLKLFLFENRYICIPVARKFQRYCLRVRHRLFFRTLLA